jgi:hypothetical protein
MNNQHEFDGFEPSDEPDGQKYHNNEEYGLNTGRSAEDHSGLIEEI